MKAILALQHGVVPQNLHFTRLPDEMARIETKLFVPQEITPWPSNGQHPRRAAVSSYGLSGTNVHAILEQAPEQATEATAPEDVVSRIVDAAPLLFPLSSTSADELRRTAGRLADWVQAHDDVALPDLAYTLARRRAHRPVRTAVIAEQPAGAHRGFARGRRRRYSVSGRGRAGRPGTGVGVLRAGFAVGPDGCRAAGDRTGVCRHRRASRAADRPRVRVLGDRRDVGAAES